MHRIQNFKIVIVGDGGVGKTAFVRRQFNGTFHPSYLATLGVEVHSPNFDTNYGQICFNCWDTAGQEKFSGLKDGYYIKSDAAIVMFDTTSRLSFNNMESWRSSVLKTAGKIPIVVVGTKTDLPPKDFSLGSGSKTDFGSDFHLVSSRKGLNIEAPFLELARKITGHQDLIFKSKVDEVDVKFKVEEIDDDDEDEVEIDDEEIDDDDEDEVEIDDEEFLDRI